MEGRGKGRERWRGISCEWEMSEDRGRKERRGLVGEEEEEDSLEYKDNAEQTPRDRNKMPSAIPEGKGK